MEVRYVRSRYKEPLNEMRRVRLGLQRKGAEDEYVNSYSHYLGTVHPQLNKKDYHLCMFVEHQPKGGRNPRRVKIGGIYFDINKLEF